MKILIVNGFSSGSKGAKKFKNFVDRIKEAFKQHKYTLASNISFVVRDLTNIDEFLYESSVSTDR